MNSHNTVETDYVRSFESNHLNWPQSHLANRLDKRELWDGIIAPSDGDRLNAFIHI